MALTQIKTGAIDDDAVNTSEIADDAVTTDKLANAINTERTANTAKASITINTNADNRIITGSGTANTLNGESNVSYYGTTLNASGFINTTAPVAWYGQQDTHHTVATDTWTTLINLGSQPANTDGWDESTGVFTVRTGKGGLYFLSAGAGIDDVQSRDFIYIGFSVNDAAPYSYTWGKQTYGSSDALVVANMTSMINLSDGATIRAKVQHNEGSSEYTEAQYCWFSGFRIN